MWEIARDKTIPQNAMAGMECREATICYVISFPQNRVYYK